MQGAAGLNVLEIGEGLSSAYAGLILSLQGGRVDQVESGLSRRLDEYERAYFDRGRAASVGLKKALQALGDYDIVLTDLHPLRFKELGLPLSGDALFDRQVLVAITSLGLHGPHSDFAMSDLTNWAAGGLAYVTRRVVPDEDIENYQPIAAPMRQPEMLGGLAAAIAALFGATTAASNDRAQLLDVSRQEVQAAMLHGVVPPFVWNHIVMGSPAARLSNIGMLLPAADGHIYIRTVEPHQWDSLVEWMETPGWSREEWALDPNQRRANWPLVAALVGEWTSQHPQEWLYAEGQRRRVPIALPREVADVLEAEQLAERGAWQELQVGPNLTTAPRVPILDVHEETSTPPAVSQGKGILAGESGLSGVRVLDMGWSWAGPYAGMILADLGAEVIKLESAGRIDILRWSGAFADGVRDYERSGYYGACNRGKKSFQLNLKAAEAQETVLRLIEECDVLIENFAPRVMDTLGLAIEHLRERNPRLVTLSMSGYGSSGPERDYVSYGDHLLHASGIASLTGFDGDPHTKLGIFYGDPVGGMYGALAILAALRDREHTGVGSKLELSQLEGLTSLIPTAFMRSSAGEDVARLGDKSQSHCPSGFYRCAGDDSWVAITVETDNQWRLLCHELHQDASTLSPEWDCEERFAQIETIDSTLGAWTKSRSAWDVTSALQVIGIPAYPVQSAPKLLWDEHLSKRDFFVHLTRPVVGSGVTTGTVFGDQSCGSYVRGYAPLLGEHNADVYCDILGWSESELQKGIHDGLIY